ncbi:TadE/TadG family type IV pilus assembly protein [Vibrio salinus]|uniref:TadE/TadG family type IV pilus assembly protein n=1 Tax=Vibrio salinus TaxID=2899784 RepID=UPI001E2C1FE2|nr:TadE/TadG family type IV pilus assembly protein [Vibrio salinus]MCE0494317.1 pilus assembly protein TadG-related protein [Vibrio salinus]
MKKQSRLNKNGSSMAGRKEKGLVAVFVTFTFLFLAGIAALAIDINYAYMDKSKLQNAVDSAALAAAAVINGDNSVDNGDATVDSTLDSVIAFTGNTEFSDIKSHLSVTYSDDPTDGASFVSAGSYSSTSEYIYIRVAITGYPIRNFFVSVFGLDKYVSASAVSGPSAPTTPNTVVPVAICEGDESTPSGYINGEIYAVKSNNSALGNGNFQYLVLEDATGADILSESLAGGYNGSLRVGDSILTEPGGNTNKGINGMNSRLGTQQQNSLDATTFPPDKYVKEPAELAELDNDGTTVLYYEDDPGSAWHYSDYKDELAQCAGGATNDDCTDYYDATGGNNRRTLVVPIVDCSTGPSGRTYVTITSFACFFLLQSMDKIGNELALFGEFIDSCPVSSGGGYDLDDGTQYRIVLFNDPLSEGS